MLQQNGGTITIYIYIVCQRQRLCVGSSGHVDERGKVGKVVAFTHFFRISFLGRIHCFISFPGLANTLWVILG